MLGKAWNEDSVNAAKAALAGITPTIAHELAPLGFTVNCVNPGPVDSASYVDDDLRASLAGRFPFGRWGEPDDPARLIAWLVSDDARIPDTLRDAAKEEAALRGMSFSAFVRTCMIEELAKKGQ